MNVWLASYPRSGNTFLRIVMKDVFGLQSASLYGGETAVFNEFADAAAVIGHDEAKSGGCEPFEGPEIGLTKTHGLPTDDNKCIYIVRDGRMALVSYFHYLRDFASASISLEDVVLGTPWPGSWSGHVQAWAPETRADTLLVKYEDLRDKNDTTCKVIGDFLQKDPIKRFDVAFSDLQRLNPKFFRSSNDRASLDEIRQCETLFLEHHGETMRALGYLPG